MKGIGHKDVFRKHVAEMKMGEQVYINSINLTVGAINLLREYIQDGTLTPVESELRKMITEEAIPKFMDGTSICPQMTYTRTPDKTESTLTELGLKNSVGFFKWSFGNINKDFTILKHTQEDKNHFLTLDMLDGTVSEVSIINNNGVIEHTAHRKQK